MKRVLLDLLGIFLILACVSFLNQSNAHKQDTTRERILRYEESVQQGVYYNSQETVLINQKEENTAGKLGNLLSTIVFEVLDSSIKLVGIFFGDSWN